MNWTPIDVVFVGLALSGALTTAAVTIIAAIKGSAAQAQALSAQAQSTANQQAINSLSSRLEGHEQQLSTLALHVPPPGVIASAVNTSASRSATPAGACADSNTTGG